MTDHKFSITINEEKVREWQREADKLLETIKADQERHALLLNRIKAVGLFIDPAPPTAQPHQPDASTPPNGNQQNPISAQLTPPEAIVSYLRRATRPIPVNALRTSLLNAGYPPEKFGQGFAYFYTVLKRLRQRGIIIQDGPGLRLNEKYDAGSLVREAILSGTH